SPTPKKLSSMHLKQIPDKSSFVHRRIRKPFFWTTTIACSTVCFRRLSFFSIRMWITNLCPEIGGNHFFKRINRNRAAVYLNVAFTRIPEVDLKFFFLTGDDGQRHP